VVFAYFGRPVGRDVVGDDELEIAEGLTQQRIKRLGEKALAIVERKAVLTRGTAPRGGRGSTARANSSLLLFIALPFAYGGLRRSRSARGIPRRAGA
jgi:hypothetical protein